jgi:hypothetical protein
MVLAAWKIIVEPEFFSESLGAHMVEEMVMAMIVAAIFSRELLLFDLMRRPCCRLQR